MRLAWFLLILLTAFVAPISISCAVAKPTVIVLSWDGMRHDYLEKGTFPGLNRLAKEGARANRLTPTYPSTTFPGHVSMATGVTPGEHGIVDNRFHDRLKGKYSYSADANWIDEEPIWIAAERQGIKAATYFWVGSETDWQGKGTTYRMAPFDGKRPESEKARQIIEWLDLPGDARPQLIMSYWAGADTVGHDHGPDSPRVVQQIHTQDKSLLTLLEALDQRALWHDVTLLLVSDHGMAPVDTFIDAFTPLRKVGLKFEFSAGPSIAHIFLENHADKTRALDALHAQPNINVLTKRRVVELGFYHPQRTGDLVLQLEPPFVFGDPERDVPPGMHGYDSESADMGALFLAMGRHVSPGYRPGEVHQLDIVPTIANLLGINPPENALGEAIRLADQIRSSDRP